MFIILEDRRYMGVKLKPLKIKSTFFEPKESSEPSEQNESSELREQSEQSESSESNEPKEHIILTTTEQKDVERQKKVAQKEEEKRKKVAQKEEERQKKVAQKEEERQRKVAQKEEEKRRKAELNEIDRKNLIVKTLISDATYKTNEKKYLELNKRYKPYFKVYYKICKGLTNIKYKKTLSTTLKYIETAIIKILHISSVDYNKNIKIQTHMNKDMKDYETDEFYTTDIIINNYSIIPNIIKETIEKYNIERQDNATKTFLNISFDTNIYNKGYDISSSTVFDKSLNSYISLELSGDEIVIEDKSYSFNINNTIKEIADKVIITNEYYDRPMINYIYHNLDYFTKILYDEKKRRKYSYEDYKNIISIQINQLLNSITDLEYKKNYRRVIFKPNEDNIKGRKYAIQKATYQSLPRTIRHLIGQKYYIDIDMKNAHFNISKNIILNKDYLNANDYSNIIKYADDRQSFYNDIKKVFPDDSDDSIKQTCISILFNKNFKISNSKYKNIPAFNKLVKEIKLLQQNLYNNEEYSHHISSVQKIIKKEEQDAIKKGEQYNILNQNIHGKVLSRILQEIENNILECIIDYLNENNIIYSALQYDGLQLLKPDKYDEFKLMKPDGFYLDDTLLHKIEEYIKIKLGIDMPLSYKSLDSNIEIPLTYVNSYEREYICLNNETDIETLFIYTNKDLLNIEKGTCIKYIFYKNKWYYDPTKFKQIVKLLLKNQNIYSMDYQNNPDIKKHIDLYLSGDMSIDSYNEIFTILQGFKLNRLDSKLDTIAKMVNESSLYGTDDFDYKINNSTIGTISFKDGVLFGNTKTFKKYPVPEVYSTLRINRDYVDFSNDIIEKQQFIRERFFDAFYIENQYQFDLLLKAIARCMFGHFRDKFWINGISYDRNSMKGTLIELLKVIFDEYYEDFECDYFCVKPSGDDLKNNSALINIRFSRFGIVQEPTKEKKINASKIKSDASGGDSKSARYFFSADKISFVPHLMYMIFCNKGLNMDGDDAYGNCLMIDYDYCFNDNITDPLREKQRRTYFGKEIKQLFSSPDYFNAFFHMLLDAYDDKPFIMDMRIKEKIENKKVLIGCSDGYTAIQTKFMKSVNINHRLSSAFFDYFKNELKKDRANETYNDIKYLHNKDYKIGLDRLSQSKRMRKCIDSIDSQNPSYGFEGIWFKDNDDVQFLVKYMKSININNDTIKERLDGLCNINNNWFSYWD